MTNDSTDLSGILDTLEDLSSDESEVSVGDVIESFGTRSIGPLITLPALLVLTPLGGVPMVPTLMAVIIALFAIQIVLQRDHLWLPDAIEKRSVSSERIEKSVNKLRPAARWIDNYFGNRLESLVEQPAPAIVACIVLLLSALVPPSEVIPFAAMLPMGAIALLGFALTLEDGLLTLLGLAVAVIGFVTVWMWLF